MNQTNIYTSSNKIYKEILRSVNELTDEELLCSEGYYEILRKIITSILRPGESLRLNYSSNYSSETGSTNGQEINVNTYSPLVLGVKQIYEYQQSGKNDDWAKQLPIIHDVRKAEYLSNVGTEGHECGHVLYTNFIEYNDIIRDVETCRLFRNCANATKLNKLYRHPVTQRTLIRVCCDLLNIVEDGFIENCLCKEYPEQGTVVKGLVIGNAVKFFLSSPADKIETDILLGNYNLPEYFIWQVQLMILGYTPKNWEKCNGTIHNIITKALNDAKPIVDDYIASPKKHVKDFCALVDILSTLFPDPDEIPNESSQNQNSNEQDDQNDDSKSGNNNSNQQSQKENNDESKDGNSDEQNSGQNESGDDQKSDEQKAIDSQKFSNGNEKSIEEDCGMSKAPSGNGLSKRLAPSGEEKQIQADTAKENAKASSDSGNGLDSLTKEVAKELSEKQIQKQQNKQMDEQHKNILKVLETETYTFEGIKQMQPNDYSKEVYNDCYKRVSKISDGCVRKIRQVLEKRDFEEEQSGFIIGTKFNANQAYRRDRLVFSKRIDPDETPDVTFSILVDQSGSMAGQKIRSARDVTILFDDVTRKLHIPTQIVGHDDDGRHVCFYNYVNYISNDKEKYSLANIEALYGNVDSIALSTLCEEVMKRPESKKVVIVISDGAPCGFGNNPDNYKGVPVDLSKYHHNRYNCALLNAVVRYYRKKGIKIIGVSIDDYDDIKRIYEEGTIDCSQSKLDNLPNELLKIFKKYVLK